MPRVKNVRVPLDIMVNVASWGLPRPRRNGPPYYSKSNVVMVLEQVGVLLELKGANPFRVRSYQNASRTLGGLEEDLWTVTSEGRLTDVKGIGKGIAGLITEALTEGTWGDIGNLYTSIPGGLIEMLAIPGLGPKRYNKLPTSWALETISNRRFTQKMKNSENWIAWARSLSRKSSMVSNYSSGFQVEGGSMLVCSTAKLSRRESQR